MKCIPAMFLCFCVIFTITNWNIVESRFLKKGEKLVADVKYVRSLDENNVFNLHLTSRRFNKTTMSLSGNITLPGPWDETHQFRFKIYTWGDGGWKFHGMTGTHDYACKMCLQFFSEGWKRILHGTRNPKTYKCPVPQGFYKVDDVYMDMSQSPYFYMSGRHRLLLQDIQYNRVLATIEAEFDIRFVPKVAS